MEQKLGAMMPLGSRATIPVNPDALPDHIVDTVRHYFGNAKPTKEDVQEFVYTLLDHAHANYGLPNAREIWLVGINSAEHGGWDISLIVRGSGNGQLTIRPDPGGGYRATHGTLAVVRPTSFEAGVAIGEVLRVQSRKVPWALADELPRRGFYVHYKGGIYFVQTVVPIAEGEAGARCTHVVYESVQGTNEDRPRANIRPIEEFLGYVDAVTGGAPGESTKMIVPRFMRVQGWDRAYPLVSTPEGTQVFVPRYGDEPFVMYPGGERMYLTDADPKAKETDDG